MFAGKGADDPVVFSHVLKDLLAVSYQLAPSALRQPRSCPFLRGENAAKAQSHTFISLKLSRCYIFSPYTSAFSPSSPSQALNSNSSSKCSKAAANSSNNSSLRTSPATRIGISRLTTQVYSPLPTSRSYLLPYFKAPLLPPPRSFLYQSLPMLALLSSASQRSSANTNLQHTARTTSAPAPLPAYTSHITARAPSQRKKIRLSLGRGVRSVFRRGGIKLGRRRGRLSLRGRDFFEVSICV